MKPAVISRTHDDNPGYLLEVRSVDGKTDSKGHFVLYHDCLDNAEANGYSVQRDKPHGKRPGWERCRRIRVAGRRIW